MGIAYNPAIITSGLVQYLDAENIRSYPGSGATWIDLSGNGNNATLIGTVTHTTDNGTSVFSLPGTTGNRIDASGPNLTSSNFTVICATRATSSQNGRIVSAGANNWLLGHHDDEAYKYYAEGWISNPGLNNQNGQVWRVYCGTGNIGASSYSLYVDGEHIVTNSNGTAGPNGWSIGRWQGSNSQYTPAMISFLICYNRVLTSQEIQQNFNALRGRFGI